jgi:hypothetical protein
MGTRAQVALRRYALLVAAHRADDARTPLRHAGNDARAMASVLSELGGVAPSDVRLHVDPSGAQLMEVFQGLAQELTDAKERGRTEVIFYYSGHSDARGLLLGTDSLPYATLRQLLNALPSTVRIAVLDSCASGAFTRQKGGVARPPFLYDASTAVAGHAFLASSSIDEASQESDELGGSYFTHAFVSGLRGAADASGEGKVTLTEAYRYAFEATLARTQTTLFGAQHAAYEMQLSGTGDLVLTDLRRTSSQLSLFGFAPGQLFVRDSAGTLLLEAQLTPKRPTALALPAGRYTLTALDERAAFQTRIALRHGDHLQLKPGDFKEVPRSEAVARGGRAPAEDVPFGLALVPSVSTNRRSGVSRVRNRVSLSLLYDTPSEVHGLSLSLGFAGAADAVRGVALGATGVVVPRLTGLSLSLGPQAFRAGIDGASVNGSLTVAQGESRGLLLAPVVYADTLSGAVVSAVSVVGEVHGLSLAAVNVARGRVRGVQLGLINFADEADVSLGVLGMTRKGGLHASLASSDVALVVGALRLDATYNYSFVAAGAHPLGGAQEKGLLYGGGVGVKLPLSREHAWVDLECGVYALQRFGEAHSFAKNLLVEPRLVLRLPWHEHFSPFAGIALHVLIHRDAGYRVRTGFFQGESTDAREVWPGYVAGVIF